MSKKSWSILCSKLLRKMGQDFLDSQHTIYILDISLYPSRSLSFSLTDISVSPFMKKIRFLLCHFKKNLMWRCETLARVGGPYLDILCVLQRYGGNQRHQTTTNHATFWGISRSSTKLILGINNNSICQQIVPHF